MRLFLNSTQQRIPMATHLVYASVYGAANEKILNKEFKLIWINERIKITSRAWRILEYYSILQTGETLNKVYCNSFWPWDQSKAEWYNMQMVYGYG